MKGPIVRCLSRWRPFACAWVLLLGLLALSPGKVDASHFRYGTIAWQPGAPTNSVQFTVQLAYRRTFFSGSGSDDRPIPGDVINPVSLNFGDGASQSLNCTVTT